MVQPVIPESRLHVVWPSLSCMKCSTHGVVQSVIPGSCLHVVWFSLSCVQLSTHGMVQSVFPESCLHMVWFSLSCIQFPRMGWFSLPYLKVVHTCPGASFHIRGSGVPYDVTGAVFLTTDLVVQALGATESRHGCCSWHNETCNSPTSAAISTMLLPIRAPSTKTECDYLNGWIKKRSHTQKAHPKW